MPDASGFRLLCSGLLPHRAALRAVILRRLRRRRISSAPGGFIKTRENTNLAPVVSWSTAERSRRRDEHCSSARFPELQSWTAADQWSALRRWRRRRRDQGIAPYAAHIGLPLHRGSRRAADSRPLYNTVRPKKMYNEVHAVDWLRPFRFREETGSRRLQPQS